MKDILATLLDAPFMILFVLMECLTAPFDAFTFTDAADFGPILLIIVGLAIIGWRRFRAPFPDPWRHWLFATAVAAAALAPIIPYVGIMRFAQEVRGVTGHWPRPMIDDPKLLSGINEVYTPFSSAVAYDTAYGGVLIFMGLALTAHLWRQITPAQRCLIAAVSLASWITIGCDPKHLFSWWLD